jgi:uncharacterized membrane protein
MKKELKETDLGRKVNVPENYIWYIFYYNPRDKRVFVPKISRWFGWTLNFGNLYSYFILIGLLALVLFLSYR